MKPIRNGLLGALVAMVTCLTSGGAFAETAEEAVAYAFLGLAADAELDRGRMHLTWQAVSASPAIFAGHGEGPGRTYDVIFTVTALTDCDYEIQLAGPPDVVRGGEALYARIHLDEVTGILAGEFQVTIEGDGFCQTGESNPNCTLVHKTDVYGTLDPARHARLVGQLQSEVCVKPQ